MRISDVITEKLLARTGAATPEQVAALKEESAHSRRPLQYLVVEKELISEKSLIQAWAAYAQIPYIELDPP